MVAPAGFGKTVLVSSWLRAEIRTAGWVSLARSDDDPSRFWAYVVAALGRAGVDISPATQEWPQSTGDVSAVTALTTVINAMARLEDDLIVVLDDFHLIDDPRIHDDLDVLLAQELPHFHLIVISRFDPPLTVARHRAHGQLTEIRGRHLAFDRSETDRFLRHEQVQLEPQVQEALFLRVEGWAAALRLVTLWVADRDDPAAAVAEFAAGDAAITDYLTAEVLAQLPDDLRDFLFATSILPCLSGPLCAAVSGRKDAGALLDALFARGLFLEAVDGTQRWFRYHQLFGELLRL